MKQFAPLLVPFSALALLVGCGDESGEEQHAGNLLEIVQADIQAPETVEVGEEMDLSVLLTQGSETVEDAFEVVFEIWKDGERNDGVLLEAEHEAEGAYDVVYTFEEDAIYLVQTHVSARDMHVMPKKMVVSGEVAEEDIQAFLDSDGSSNDVEESQHHH
ncbi:MULTISPECIES: FixH family protein [Bacillaceae]|uniref:FixH family protein n=1 Tax=Shouchella oshimensis TaxID=290588 RepID=UPI0006EBFBE2|nr:MULTISPECIES: FixH family protein [Bacillaceae]